MAAELQVEMRPLADGRIEASFAGEVDVSNVTRFRESLAQVTSSGSGVANLTTLTYLDSAGIEALFEVARRANLEIVAGPECQVRRLLDVVSLGTVATVLDEAPA